MTDENIPIDIHFHKLLDWLIDRRHCKRDWSTNTLVIRQKINNAIQDMPAVEEITELLKGTYINYFHCLRIVELLKDTEASSKNIFGRYSSHRMKDWQEIVRLYGHDNTGLAEAAQMLMRNVQYEVPSIKKQINKCANLQEECARKESDYASHAKEVKEQYYLACRQIGIQGNKIRRELVALLDQLPSTYETLAKQSQDLKAACEYYSAFVKFTTRKENASCLEMLVYVQNSGNTTIYEYRTGNAPEVVEEIKVNIPVEGDEDAAAADDEIDFSVVDNDDEIDFGITLDEGGESSQIDFGDDIGKTGSFEIVDVTEDNGILTSSLKQENENGVARGTDALTILDCTKTRNQFIDDLLELEAFMTQRASELSVDGDVLASSLFQSAPRLLQEVQTEQVHSMLQKVQHLIAELSSLKMQHLFMIKSSPRYVERVADNLKKKLNESEKSAASCRLMREKHEAARIEQQELEPKLKLIVMKTKKLQKQISEEISIKYKNRPVNIMGAINMM